MLISSIYSDIYINEDEEINLEKVQFLLFKIV